MIEFCIASVYTTHEAWGTKTSSGKPLRDNGMTLAHKTASLLSLLKVTNLQNGRSAILQVIDRGPFVPGRCVDLTLGAAKAIGLDGLGKVKVEPWRD